MCEYGDEDVADDYECEYERVNQNILDFAKELKAPLLTRKNSKQTEPTSTASTEQPTRKSTRKNKNKNKVNPPSTNPPVNPCYVMDQKVFVFSP